MKNKLAALALIRGAITEDVDVLQVLTTEHPPTPELLAELVTLAAGILEHGVGRERALATIDGWLQALLSGSSQ